MANPFIPVQGIHYTVRLINAKMSSMHIWSWKPFKGQDTDCVHTRVWVCVCFCLFECVQAEGQSGGGVEGEGSTLYFSFLAYQPWKASVVQ